MSATTNKLQIYNQLKLSVLGSLASMLPWWRILMICTIRKVLILIKVSSKPKEIDFAITKLSALISKPHCSIWQRWTHLIELFPSSFATGWKTTRLRYQIPTHSLPTKFLPKLIDLSTIPIDPMQQMLILPTIPWLTLLVPWMAKDILKIKGMYQQTQTCTGIPTQASNKPTPK